jgi:hypothetical protein
MQPEAWNIHIGQCAGRVQPGEDIAQLAGVFRENAALVVVFVEALQPLVAYRRDRPGP